MRTKKMILLAFVAILISSFKKEFERYELPEGLIPYELGQIISFIDSEGQAIDLIVIENNTEWIQDPDGAFGNYTSYEKKTIILKSEANNLEIKLQINWSSTDRLLFTIFINNSWEFALTSDKKGKFLYNGYNYFYESLEINGKVYYDVVEHQYHVFKQLFYNKTYGILQINMGGENFLTINH